VRRLAWIVPAGSAVVLLLAVLLFPDQARRGWAKLRHALSPAGIEWDDATARFGGFDRGALDALRDDLAARRTWSLLVVRHGRIVYEWYAPRAATNKGHYTASLAKSLVGGMGLLVALNDGKLDLDDPASRFIPAWSEDPLRARVTLRQLASHLSGLEDAEEAGLRHDELDGWKEQFWTRDADPFGVVLDNARPSFAPGDRFSYSSTGFAVLGYAVTASLRDSDDDGIRGLLRRRIMEPIGVPGGAWSVGYEEEYRRDGLRLHPVWGGGFYTTRAVARVGQLLLDRGRVDGRQLVAPEWIEAVTTHSGAPLPDRSRDPAQPASTAGWFSNFDGVWPSVPVDAFAGAGRHHQLLLVVPSMDLVVVRFGSHLHERSSEEGFWEAADAHLFRPLMEARLRSPYPPSPVIREVSFDPPANIVRKAVGSDNWPITWADDDLLYTSYGDGRGFEPKIDEKLSLGLARITGEVGDFRGENLRAPTAERRGDGPSGAKASGMLCVDGVLYMWVRNVDNAQIVWSEDHGATWEWGPRFRESFGSPTFLNFGRDYAGARDDRVYVYSQDGPNAYDSDDGVLLARVDRRRIREREAYEYFGGLDAAGRPIWVARIEDRQPVFRFEQGCARADVVYHSGLGRYLMALGFDHEGGWGLFDASEPWGPWTTAFFTGYWGLGRTHGYRIPSKWIDEDGSIAVVFSGRAHERTNYDAFSVRRARLHPTSTTPRARSGTLSVLEADMSEAGNLTMSAKELDR
jgi:CubicO group peptidase (beta-lactamase class C family)